MYNKTLAWRGQHLLISNGRVCSLLLSEMEQSRDFETADSSALSPDGTLVVSRDPDKVVRVRRVVQQEWRPGAVLFSCQQLPAAVVLGYAWSPDGQLLAVQLTDGSNHVYQMKHGRNRRPGQHLAVYRLATLLSSARTLAFAPGGNRLALADQTGAALWEATSGKKLFSVGQGFLRSIAWSPNGLYLALGGNDSTVEIYLARHPGKLVRAWTGHTSPVCALAWSPNGKQLASGDQNGNILCWSTQGESDTWGPLGLMGSPMHAGIGALAWSPDSMQVAGLDQQDQLDTFALRHRVSPSLP